MPRPIDANAFREYVCNNSICWLNDWSMLGVLAAIDKQPTVDAAPGVRCRNCKYSKTKAWVSARSSRSAPGRHFIRYAKTRTITANTREREGNMTPKEELIRVLEIRQELGKSAVKKYDTVVKMRCEDGKIRGMMGFYGANRTGRYCFAAGTLVQSQENGLVPIESISSEDLVWDGKNFVSCDGAVCNGFRPVGLLEGICVTPDHLLKKSFGADRWKRADEYKGFEMLPECALVYDIRDCGKNHCYAVYSENERQQFIAHNCSHGVQLQNLKRTHVANLDVAVDTHAEALAWDGYGKHRVYILQEAK